jgi:hypothetical protein
MVNFFLLKDNKSARVFKDKGQSPHPALFQQENFTLFLKGIVQRKINKG